jgi:two-component system, OmpR family, alkaline phosphatase synthesis response regulator PhoP
VEMFLYLSIIQSMGTVHKYKLLLVEDEKSLHEIIRLNFELEGFEVISAFDGEEGVTLFNSLRPDVVVLDVMMPKLNGFEVCQKITQSHWKAPLIFLSARDEAQDRIYGLEIGADDYLAKPFHFKELLLRVNKLLERKNDSSMVKTVNRSYQIGDAVIDFESFKVRVGSETYDLTEKQLNTLALLIENKNKVVSRTEILQKVWGYDTVPNTRTIDNIILLYRKIFEESSKVTYFKSIRGVGYMYVES